MILSSGNSERTAVIFLKDGKPLRQLRYSEFEALLDHFCAIPEFASLAATAVYVDINGALKIISAVFFTIKFDSDGYTDPEWNIPLQLLATEGEPGPELGGGVIRLATRSRCPVSWHQDQLWDPPLTGDARPFDALVELVRENRLGLTEFDVEPEAVVPDVAEDGIPVLDTLAHKPIPLQASERKRLAGKLMAVRAKTKGLKQQHQQQLAQVYGRHRQQMQQLEQAVSELQSRLNDEHQVSSQLKHSLDCQAEHFGKMRKLISQQISRIEDGESLGEQLGAEFNVKLDAATAELQEELERKNVEIFYRDGDIKCMGEKISALEQQKLALQEELAGSDILRQMNDAGICFVASQPGAGEFRVPQEDVPSYLQSPQDYAARYCYVDIQLYRDWVEHDNKPVCSHLADDGSRCALPVHRVSSPATFEPGESDRCSQHKTSSLTLRQVMGGAAG